jgi:hypothetical protein
VGHAYKSPGDTDRWESAQRWLHELSATSVSLIRLEAFARWFRDPTNKQLFLALNREDQSSRRHPEARRFH